MNRWNPCIVVLSCSLACATTSDDPTYDEDDAGIDDLDGAEDRLADYAMSCEMQVVDGALGDEVLITIRNDGEDDQQFLKWKTPWDLHDDVFESTEPEVELVYHGWYAKYRPITEASFVTVPAGSTVDVQYPITERYIAAVAGDYPLELRESTMQVRDGDDLVPVDHGCGSITYAATDEPFRLSYHEDCPDGAKEKLDVLMPLTVRMVDLAKAQTGNVPLFEKYFGTYGEWKAAEVRAHMEAIRTNEIDEDIRCDGPSDCEGANGISPGWNDQIYLCGNVWDNDAFNPRSSSSITGVIVHEYTHQNGSSRGWWDPDWTPGSSEHPFETIDINDLGQCGGDCYGYPNAVALADDPTCDDGDDYACKAIWNAENFEHFAQDAYLSMILPTL